MNEKRCVTSSKESEKPSTTKEDPENQEYFTFTCCIFEDKSKDHSRSHTRTYASPRILIAAGSILQEKGK